MHLRPTRGHRQLFWLIAVIAAGGAGVFSGPWAWVEGLENHALDFRFQVRGASGAAPQSVIVGVADSTLTLAERAPELVRREPTLAAMAAPFPWNRRVYADVVRKLRACGAKAIVFDIVYDAENPGDAEFARALAEPGAPVVLASVTMRNAEPGGGTTVKHQEPREVLRTAAGGRIGYADVFPDADGVLRFVTTAKRATEFAGQAPIQGEALLPSLALAVVQAVRPAAAFTRTEGYLNYLGPDRTIPTIPIEDLFDPGRWNSSWLRAGQLFRDQVVWVGWLSEVQFKDNYVTPFGSMAGVETQAQAFETLRERGVLRPLGVAATLACVWLLALAGVIVAWAARRVSVQLAIVVGVVAAWGGLALGLFSGAGLVLPMVAPLGAWLVAGGGGAGDVKSRGWRRGALTPL